MSLVQVYHLCPFLSTQGDRFVGNGKGHRTPTPQGLRKIKRISSEVFLSLKELVNSIKACNSITPRGYRKKSKSLYNNQTFIVQHNVCGYVPTNIINVRKSSPWQWRRVNEWDRYINDPYENIKGHMITRIC